MPHLELKIAFLLIRKSAFNLHKFYYFTTAEIHLNYTFCLELNTEKHRANSTFTHSAHHNPHRLSVTGRIADSPNRRSQLRELR